MSQSNANELMIFEGPSTSYIEPADLLLQASAREGMSVEQARDLLERYSDGFLSHDAMDAGSFVFETHGGESFFYHVVDDTVTPWDWATDTAEFGDGPSAWSYSPATEMMLTKGGIDWWNELRDGNHISHDPQPRFGR